MLHFGRRNIASRKHDVLIAFWQHHQNLLTIHWQLSQKRQHFFRHILMEFFRPGAKDNTAMTELWCADATLSSTTRAFLFVRLSATTGYFTASFCRSISLTAIHQLCCNNLVENRHIGGNSEHLLAQFELFYGLSGHVIHCSRRHFGYLITCFLIMSNPPLAPGTEPFTTSRLRSGSA